VKVEVTHAARSPVLVLACALSIWMMWGPWLGGTEPRQEWGTDNYWSLLYRGVFILGGAFLMGAWTVSRERPSTTQEMFAPAPVGRWLRTVSVLLTAAVPVAAAVLLVVVQQALVVRAGGVTIGDPPFTQQVRPSIIEWATLPAAALASYTAAAATVTLVKSRAVTALIGAMMIFFSITGYWLFAWLPLSLFSPLGLAIREDPVHGQDLSLLNLQEHAFSVPNVDSPFWALVRPDPLLSAGHSIYLIGAALIFATIALARTAPNDPRTRRIGLTGALLIVIGVVVQVASYAL